MRKLYVVFDKVGRDFLGPFMLFANDFVAGRSVGDACGEGTMLQQHPEDYQLLCVGELKNEQLVAYDVPLVVLEVVDLVKPSGALADSPREEQRVFPFVKEA